MATLDSLAQSADDPRVPDLEEIFHEHVALVWSSLRRLGVAPGDLDDATQEVFVVLHRRRASIGADQVRPWLYGTARRIASRYRRGDARRGRLVSAVALVDEDNPTLDDDATQREAIAMVEDFLAGLDDDKREVFVLAEIEQMSGKEIAAALAIRPDTVWSRLRAARESFDRHFTKVRAELVRASGSRARLESRDALALSRRAKAPSDSTRRRVAAALAVRLSDIGAIAKPAWWAAAVSTQTWIVAGTIAVGTTALVGVREAMTDPPTTTHAAKQLATDDEPTPAPAPIVAEGLPHVAPPPTVIAPPAPKLAPPKRAPITAPEPAPATSTLAAELALLERAREASPEQALALTESHARDYPNSQLAADGLAIRVAALCDLGRDAKPIAAKLAQLQPSSPWANGCREKTSTKPPSPGDDPG